MIPFTYVKFFLTGSNVFIGNELDITLTTYVNFE